MVRVFPRQVLDCSPRSGVDASGALGYGAYFKGHWFRGDWAPEQALNPVTGISIAWQELYVIVLAALVWGPQWGQKHLLFFCDNEAAVQAINSGTAKCPHLASLMRTLVLQSMKRNFFIHAEHIPGVSNSIVYSLSHNQLQRFRTLAPHADWHLIRPTLIPEEVYNSFPT